MNQQHHDPKKFSAVPVFTLPQVRALIVRELILSLKTRPQDFKLDDRDSVLKDMKTFQSWWVASGRGFYGEWNHTFGVKGFLFAYWDQWRFHRALKRWRMWVKKQEEGKLVARLTRQAMKLYDLNHPEKDGQYEEANGSSRHKQGA